MFGFFNHSGCRGRGKCSGCEWVRIGREEQLVRKKEILRRSWHANNLPTLPEKITIHTVGDKGLSSVVDLAFRRSGRKTRLGFYDISREKILNAVNCPTLSDDLRSFLIVVTDNPPPIGKASFRFRVNHHGQRGMWVDAANLDIRVLLNEKKWLEAMMEEAHVEMGQKRKYVTQEHNELRLDKAMIRPWFTTPLKKRNKHAPLWTVVGSFTQPSIKANRTLVHHVVGAAKLTEAKTWLEFGAGCGNFTLPFGDEFEKVAATEISPLSREGLNKTINHHRLAKKIDVLDTDLLRNTEQGRKLMSSYEGLLVNPPRTGLHQGLNTLAQAENQPKHIVYVSCYAESFAKDVQALYELGYKLKAIEGIDQFPDNPHCEWIGSFSKTN